MMFFEKTKKMDMNVLLETGGEAAVALLRLITDLGKDNIFVNLDPANMLMYGYANPVDALYTIGKYVRNFHGKDGVVPTDPRVLGAETPVGEGMVDFYKVFKKLKELGYNRFITIEREITGDKQTEDILKAKKEHPEALLAVHPECSKDVVKHSDMAGSTAEIIDFALKSDKPVIIGTERGVADYLIPKHPEKKFYHLCPDKLVCRDMKYTTPESILKALRNEGGEKIRLPEELIRKAKHSIDEMLRLG